MSDAVLDSLLSEDKAYWVDSKHSGLLDDSTIVREWRNVPLEHRVACVTALRARRSETDPKAQQKAYSGKYRIVTVEDLIPKSGPLSGTLVIRETLAYGLATSITDADAELVVEESIPGDGASLGATVAHAAATTIQQTWAQVTLRWSNLEPNSLASIMAGRTDLTKTNIAISSETLTGTWYILSRKPSWAEDGSGVYEEKWGLAEWKLEAFGKIGTGSETSNRVIEGVPKHRVNTVLAAEIALLSTNYGGEGYSYEQKIFWKDDVATIVCETTQAKAQAVTQFNATYNYEQLVTEKSGQNILSSGLTDYSATKTDGHSVSVSRRINKDGTYDVVLRDAQGLELNISAYTHERTPDYTSTLAVFKNSETLPALGDSYGRCTYRLNEYNLYDGEVVIVTYSTNTTVYAGQSNMTERMVETRNDPSTGYNQYRVVVVTFDQVFRFTHTDALQAIDGGLNGSGFDSVGRSIFLCKKVKQIQAYAWHDSPDGTYTIGLTTE